MTQSVPITFKYHCQRCGFSWSTTFYLLDDERVVFCVCGSCSSLVRPFNTVNYKIFDTIQID